MPAVKSYTRKNFENYPSTNTPLNANNLNHLDKGIDDLDDLLVTARNNIETLQSNATTDEANILALQGETREINDNLSGFKFYPTGTQLVAYIEGHGWYNTDGKYVVWGTATANALVEASPNTYYGRPSEEDCRGEVGADSATPFNKNEEISFIGYNQVHIAQGSGKSLVGTYDITNRKKVYFQKSSISHNSTAQPGTMSFEGTNLVSYQKVYNQRYAPISGLWMSVDVFELILNGDGQIKCYENGYCYEYIYMTEYY